MVAVFNFFGVKFIIRFCTVMHFSNDLIKYAELKTHLQQVHVDSATDAETGTIETVLGTSMIAEANINGTSETGSTSDLSLMTRF